MKKDNNNKCSDFFEVENSQEYKYRILVWPNITYPENLEQDSYVIVLHNIIKYLNQIRKDLFWVIVSPSHIHSLDFDNSTQILYPFPTYPNTMRVHFDALKISKILDINHNDYDLVYSHLPEHTLALKNIFYNRYNVHIPFIGYAHFFEFPDTLTFEKNTLLYSFGGICEMNHCGINTQFQKELVMKYAEELLSKKMLEKMDKILQPQYLGNEEPEYGDEFVTLNGNNNNKIIVFNHRPVPYKDYPWFLQQMDILWKQRKDFKVWVPLEVSNSNNIPYLITGYNKTRKEYLSNLSKCSFGVASQQKYAGWSVSVTDGFSVGLPYLLFDEGYYKELAGDIGIYFNKKNFLELVNKMLNSTDKNNKGDCIVKRELIIKRSKQFLWSNVIQDFNDRILNKELNNLPFIDCSESTDDIVRFIKKNKFVTKSDIRDKMNWGTGIRWDLYRNTLRNRPEIRLTSHGYEYYK